MPVHKYLDLSTAHLTESDAKALEPYGMGDLDHSPRVIDHGYGAWVNVPDIDGPDDDEDAQALRDSYPSLAICIEKARQLDCTWINFDRDAPTEEGLPTHDW